jgi:hypothetical protein
MTSTQGMTLPNFNKTLVRTSIFMHIYAKMPVDVRVFIGRSAPSPERARVHRHQPIPIIQKSDDENMNS